MSIGGGGCGPTSAAMLISTITGKTCLPTTTMKWACQKGFVYANQGTSYGYFEPQFKEYGISCKQIPQTCLNAQSNLRPQVIKALQEGYYFIALMKKGLWTSGGHYIVVWWADNKIHINDPASTADKRINGDPDTFFSQAKYFWQIDAREFNKKAEKTMKVYTQNSVSIVEVPISQFKITIVDEFKKKINKTNFCNAGFFTPVTQNGSTYTFPVNHIIADYKATSNALKAHLQYCGKIDKNKAIFDTSSQPINSQFGQKAITTLIIKDNKANIDELISLPNNASYAIGGIAIMRNGQDVSWLNFVKPQGWTGKELYATQHIFVGLKEKNATTIYVMAWKSSSLNLIYSAEAYKKFKQMGFKDIIKLDGGGSFIFKADNIIKQTSENRRINSIIEFGPAATSIVCPYIEPTSTVKKGSSNTLGVKWVQWQLNQKGYACTIDGSFGPGTDALIRQFQKDNNLVVDGSVGPATRKLLKG